ncbi:MAG: cytochrome b [Xanthomonadales bacterium]|nr:Cytochrome b561 [Xanthomonadales bacterium]MCC6592345.1 cytochrome b [Xanthomonadales bacterium]MCE7930188.1 cytochrome b [Xanthomonadales bacterium PRO6]
MRHTPDFSFAPEPVARYSGLAITLHWLLALLVIGLLGVGVWMTGLKTSPTKIAVYGWHKALGLTVLALAVLRLLWRVHRPPPPLAESIPAWQVALATQAHRAMYTLLLAMPLSGWLQNSAAGFPLTWFGLFKVPALIARDKAAFAFWQQAHEWLSWALMALIVLHVLAALKHHYLDRDDALKRILPWKP